MTIRRSEFGIALLSIPLRRQKVTKDGKKAAAIYGQRQFLKPIHTSMHMSKTSDADSSILYLTLSDDDDPIFR